MAPVHTLLRVGQSQEVHESISFHLDASVRALD